jgi:hypothetical protein
MEDYGYTVDKVAATEVSAEDINNTFKSSSTGESTLTIRIEYQLRHTTRKDVY